MTTYRTGNHWGVTIVREDDCHCPGETPHPERGMQPGAAAHAQLVAVVVNGDHALAERICALLNGDEKCPHGRPGGKDCGPCAFDRAIPLAITYSCTCTVVGPDPDCIVHQGRRARGPKPPPVGPGCICDGSGRTCPRHGVVL